MSLVSIIIPCYNYGWVLAETLDSVLAQTHQQWECIIVDDGSTDTTRTVAESYQARDPRFHYLYQPNAGISAARNCGLAQAQGDYIQFLDADDLLVSSKLAIQVTFLTTHSEVDVVYGDVRYFPHGEPQVRSRSFDLLDKPWMSGAQGQGTDLLHVLLESNIMVTPAALFRASLLQKVGFFAKELRAMEDWEYWVRCTLAGARFHYDPTPAAWSLVRVHTTSTNQNVVRMLQFEVQARQKLRPLLRGQVADIRSRNEAGLTATCRILADYARQKVVAGDWRTGIREYIYVANKSGQHLFYFKTLLYWLKMRIKAPSAIH